MIAKPFSEIAWADIDALVADAVEEGRTIDFKRDLPGPTDEDKRELLADVSSFANTMGGDIVFGVNEVAGVATEVVGVSSPDFDREQLRLEEILRGGLDPRIPPVEMRVVSNADSSSRAFVVRVRRSYAAPHMVTFKSLSRFFARHSKGKYQLDVREIKAAFLGGEEAHARMVGFRNDRIARVRGGEPPMPLAGTNPAMIFLHLIPLTLFRFASPIEGDLQNRFLNGVRPLDGTNLSRINVDGFVASARLGDEVSSYAQFFRDCTIETLGCDIVREGERKVRWFLAERLRDEVIASIAAQVKFLRSIDVPAPFVLLTSMVGMRGTVLYLGGHNFTRFHVPCDRDALFLPDVMIDDDEAEFSETLRPVFDAMWNAFGVVRSPAQ